MQNRSIHSRSWISQSKDSTRSSQSFDDQHPYLSRLWLAAFWLLAAPRTALLAAGSDQRAVLCCCAGTAVNTLPQVMQGGSANSSGQDGAGFVVRVSQGKTKYEVSLDGQHTVAQLKELVAIASGVTAAEQKLLFKGKQLSEDEVEVGLVGLKAGSKLMLMTNGGRGGSTRKAPASASSSSSSNTSGVAGGVVAAREALMAGTTGTGATASTGAATAMEGAAAAGAGPQQQQQQQQQQQPEGPPPADAVCRLTVSRGKESVTLWVVPGEPREACGRFWVPQPGACVEAGAAYTGSLWCVRVCVHAGWRSSRARVICDLSIASSSSSPSSPQWWAPSGAPSTRCE
eukprot:COSAG01_NODE_411_length_17360_cov_11.401852_14_plen_344_part_00